MLNSFIIYSSTYHSLFAVSFFANAIAGQLATNPLTELFSISSYKKLPRGTVGDNYYNKVYNT